jgi:drug efflux transport system ATP-binding protein
VAEAALVGARTDGAAAPAVEVREFGKRYGGRVAVDGASFTVAPAELYGLIGPDGAGKSTLLKAVAGVLSFDRGRVAVFGVSLDSERAAERVKGRLGFMPQGLGLNLYPELSIEENVDFFARLRLVPAAALAERKARLLDITRLAAFRDRPMKHLSGGMKQKLGLVCTLIHHPDLVILDEPTTGVDPVSRRDFWAILAELMRERAMTTLVSTAYMDEASRFHRLAFIHGGRVLAEGAPDEMRTILKGRVDRSAEVDDERTAVRGVERGGDIVDEPDLEDVFIGLMSDHAAVDGAGRLPEDDARRASATATAEALRHEEGPAPTAAQPRSTSHGGDLVIDASRLTRDFGTFRAVDDVSFEIRAGEVFGLLGANGAGKTTVIKMLTGILRPTAGVGHVAGVDMRRPGIDIKRRIGYMSQAFSLYQDLTVVENVRLYAGIYGLSRAETERRTEWALAMGGLSGHEHSPTARLPMGMRQRLALGCALLHRPRALFLDEPTSGVDPLGRRQFWDILFALAREDGVAVLVTTHAMTEADRCDRLALMFAGRIVADAPPAELKRSVEVEAGRLLEVATDDPTNALIALTAAGFTSASPFGNRIRLLSLEPERDGPRIRETLAGAGVAVHAVERRPITMEEVFVHRVTTLERAAARSPA